MRRENAFTLVELSIAILIMVMLFMLALPSLSGVLADHRLRRLLDGLNGLVRTAQERSVNERQPYLIIWKEDRLDLQQEALVKGKRVPAISTLRLRKGESFKLGLPAALAEKRPAEWIFWTTGTCEPAVVTYRSADGGWVANYSPLTGRPELKTYATR